MSNKIQISGTIAAIERFEEPIYKRNGGDIVTDIDGQPVVAFTRYSAMVLVQDGDKLVQWFGGKDTAFWSHFSSKAATPLAIGDNVIVSGNVKTIKPADKYFGERTVITHPKLG